MDTRSLIGGATVNFQTGPGYTESYEYCIPFSKTQTDGGKWESIDLTAQNNDKKVSLNVETASVQSLTVRSISEKLIQIHGISPMNTIFEHS